MRTDIKCTWSIQLNIKLWHITKFCAQKFLLDTEIPFAINFFIRKTIRYIAFLLFLSLHITNYKKNCKNKLIRKKIMLLSCKNKKILLLKFPPNSQSGGTLRAFERSTYLINLSRFNTVFLDRPRTMPISYVINRELYHLWQSSIQCKSASIWIWYFYSQQPTYPTHMHCENCIIYYSFYFLF